MPPWPLTTPRVARPGDVRSEGSGVAFTAVSTCQSAESWALSPEDGGPWAIPKALPAATGSEVDAFGSYLPAQRFQEAGAAAPGFFVCLFWY